MSTPRKPAAAKRKGPAKPKPAKRTPAIDRREVFIRQYLIHKNKARAYREAGFDTSPQADRQNAHRLFTTDYVQSRIQDERSQHLAALDVQVATVFDKLKAVAFGDAAAITEYVTGACRYCHGVDHRYQWRTHREFADAMEVYMGKGELHHAVYAPPENEGGYGFRQSAAPHPDCPECEGEGVSRVRFKDTRLMTDDERKFFAGVKQTQHGIEFKFNDQMAALKDLAEHLQFFKARDEANANAIGRLIADLHSRGEISRMPMRADTAQPEAES